MLIVRTHFPPIHFCKGSCGKGHWGGAWPSKRGGMGEGREAVVQLGRRRCIWTVVIATGWLSQKVPWQRALQCSEGRCSLKPLVPAEGQYMLLLTPQYKHTYTSMTWKWLRDPQYCRNTWRTNCTLTFRVSFSFLQSATYLGGVPLVFLWEEDMEERGTLYHQLLQGRL